MYKRNKVYATGHQKGPSSESMSRLKSSRSLRIVRPPRERGMCELCGVRAIKAMVKGRRTAVGSLSMLLVK